MVIGICGAISGGKSTTSKMLLEFCKGYRAYAFADALKEECANTYTDIPKEEFGWNGTEWTGPKTERGRNKLCEHAEMRRTENPDHWLGITQDQIHKDGTKLAIIQDARYCNELDWIARNGKVVYVQNPAKEREYIAQFKAKGTSFLHPSELEWRFWLLANPSRYITIDNSDTLERLKLVVTGYLDHELKRIVNWE